jgi:lipopolysaccharide transport system ATP-binding protein
MSNTVIKIENLSKIYRLGEVGTGTLSHDLNRWWKMNILGKEDPYAKIGHVNDRTQKAEKGELVAALRDINLEVKQGEVLGIIGKNGAGKSTLLKLLSRVTSPTTGVIKTKGRLASLLEVGTGFHPEMTGKENIYMNGTIMGMRKWEITNKLDEIVDFAGVAKYLDTPTKRYSSGMTVRLGFAIAAFLEPEILIVDEVLAVGDAEFQKKAIGKMQDVSKGGGRTVLFVSHNMASVEALCEKAILLENGEVIFDSNVSDVISKYIVKNDTNGDCYDIDLMNHPNRRSGRPLILTSIKSFVNNRPSNTHKLGDALKFEIRYNNNNLRNAKISLIFENDLSQRVFTVSNEFGTSMLINNRNGVATCFIEDLGLVPAKYYVSVFIHNDKDAGDAIDHVLRLDVLEGDYFNSGKLPSRNKGQYLVRSKWEFEN